MKFEIEAVITEIGAIETVGQKGFQKRNLILTEQGEYENLVCVEFSGEKLERPDLHQVGQLVTVSGFINCREWNGSYFTSLRGLFIQNVDEQPQQTPQQPAFGSAPQAQAQIPVPQTQAPVNAVAPQPVQSVAQQQYQQQPANMAPPVISQQGGSGEVVVPF